MISFIFATGWLIGIVNYLWQDHDLLNTKPGGDNKPDGQTTNSQQENFNMVYFKIPLTTNDTWRKIGLPG